MRLLLLLAAPHTHKYVPESPPLRAAYGTQTQTDNTHRRAHTQSRAGASRVCLQIKTFDLPDLRVVTAPPTSVVCIWVTVSDYNLMQGRWGRVRLCVREAPKRSRNICFIYVHPEDDVNVSVRVEVQWPNTLLVTSTFALSIKAIWGSWIKMTKQLLQNMV